MIKICKSSYLYLNILLVVLIFNGCLQDIPSSQPDGPTRFIYGKVINTDTGTPIPDAVISDGFTTVSTDTNGEYRFISPWASTHVFISVPAEYEIPMVDGMPQIFETIDSSKDSVQVNFSIKPLINGVEKEFTLIAVADPQVRIANHLVRLNDETIPDIKNTLENHNNVYGLTLGDVGFDNLSMFSDIKQSFISTNIPFFHTIGNHDFSAIVYEPAEASEDFVSHFGPLNYSFNRGEAHIVVMNNVFNYGVTSYNWGFSEEQINWLKSDLNHVSKDKMVIVSVHIPVLPTTKMERRSQFLAALSSFNEVHILSGHWHTNENIIHSDMNLYEHITGAASGNVWYSIVNKCGAPNGYAVYEISGNQMKNWYYKSVNYDKEHQIRLIEPYSFGDTEGYVIANVWNADENWKVELFEDGINTGQMEQFRAVAPEVYALAKSGMKTDHLFRLKPTNNDAVFSIKATDPFGNIYHQTITFKSINELKTY